MEWIWIVLLIGISVVNGIRKNKKRQEAERNIPSRASGPESGTMQTSPTSGSASADTGTSAGAGFAPSSKVRTRAQMVEDQRRRAQAYQQQAGYPVNALPKQQDVPPWKRTTASPTVPDGVPVAQRLETPPADPPVKPIETRPAPAHRPQPPQKQTGTFTQSGRDKGLVTPSTKGTATEALQLPQSSAAWRQALVLSEILAPPKAKRPFVGNRRI